MIFIIILLFIIALWLVPKIITIFGNETFDENKNTGRTIRTTPKQKAARFKFYLTAVFALIILIVILVKV